MIRTAFMITMIYLILILLPVGAGAHLPQGNWWDSKEIRESLQLTGEQSEKIKKVVTEAQQDIMELRREYDAKSKRLKDSMNIEKMRSMPEKEIRALLEEVQAIRNKIEKARFIVMVRTLKILNDEQANKLSERQEEMRKRLIDKFQQRSVPGEKPLPQPKEGKQ